MTYTRPRRLTSLQFSQIRLTLERTFMANLNWAESLHKSRGTFHCKDARARDKVHLPDFFPFFFDWPEASRGTITFRTHAMSIHRTKRE